MPTRSPTELILKNAQPGLRPVDFAAVTWESRATFGPYLRGLRESARLSLRAASQDLGVSFSYLAKLETWESFLLRNSYPARVMPHEGVSE